MCDSDQIFTTGNSVTRGYRPFVGANQLVVSINNFNNLRRSLNPIRPGEGGALCARIVFILRLPKFFNSNYVLKFFDFS